MCRVLSCIMIIFIEIRRHQEKLENQKKEVHQTEQALENQKKEVHQTEQALEQLKKKLKQCKSHSKRNLL